MTEFDDDGQPVSRTMFSADRQVGERQPININPPKRRLW
jgi:hypothetical protein